MERVYRPWMIVGAALLMLLYLLAPILTPFIIAAGFAYLGDPTVDWLERRGLARTAAGALVFLVFSAAAIVALALLLPVLEAQALKLIANLPQYLEWLYGRVRIWLAPYVFLSEHLDAAALRKMIGGSLDEAGSLLPQALGWLSRPGLGLLA